jgi:hypothetical protein
MRERKGARGSQASQGELEEARRSQESQESQEEPWGGRRPIFGEPTKSKKIYSARYYVEERP